MNRGLLIALISTDYPPLRTSAAVQLRDLAQQFEAARPLIDAFNIFDAHRETRRVVIAQVLSNSRQGMTHIDADGFQMCRRTDAGYLQQLRRIDDTAG